MHQSVCRRGFGQELGRSLHGFWDDEVTGRMGEGAVTSLLEDSSLWPGTCSSPVSGVGCWRPAAQVLTLIGGCPPPLPQRGRSGTARASSTP